MSRGFFEIGIVHGKNNVNIGTLWRSAYQLGAGGIFTIGRRYTSQASDTTKAWRHIPLRHFDDFDEFNKHRPREALIIGIEMGGEPLHGFKHPERAIYLLGAEDHGLSQEMLNRCNKIVSLDAKRVLSFNVAVAGSLIMYDRFQKGAPK